MANESADQRVMPTIDLDGAAQQRWQAVVVGAGPAGSLAALELARRGVIVLLVDKSEFPRYKVCGGFLGAAAMGLINDCGLDHLAGQLGASPTTTLQLYTRGASARLQLSAGIAVSRERFDTALIREAILAGAHFLDGTTAKSNRSTPESRQVDLSRGSSKTQIDAQLVLAADGLAGSLLAGQNDLNSKVAPDARIGIGTIVDCQEPAFESGIIYMTYATGGYLGLVRHEDGRLNAAAAFDAQYIRQTGGPAEAAMQHLKTVGLPQPESLARHHWFGTLPLTRQRPRLAAHRLLVIGDSTGYIEPFTGEGMTWALMSGRAVIPAAMEGIEAWQPGTGERWEQSHRRWIRRRQKVCQAVVTLLRRPALSRNVVRLLARLPWLARPAVRSVEKKCPSKDCTSKD